MRERKMLSATTGSLTAHIPQWNRPPCPL
jgi:hypothetical protein